MTRGGLDRYLGPEAGDSSNVPMEIENAQVTEAPTQVDCAGRDKDEAVCQIAEAERAKTQPRKD